MEGPWPAIAVAALAVVAHLGALRVPFVYDDWAQVLDNPFLKHPQALRKIFGGNVWDFVGHAGISNFYRPLMHVWYYALYQLFGPHPGWFHLANLLLHAGVCLLVLAVVSRLSGSRATGFLAALFFAVYPLHSEVIAWVACAPELLCALFSLAAILLYLKSAEARGLSRALAAIGTGVCLLLAALSKEIALAVPVLLIVWEWLSRGSPGVAQHGDDAPEKRSSPRRLAPRTARAWPAFAAMGVAVGIYLAARINALGALLPVKQAVKVTGVEYAATALALFYRYALLAVWPFSLNFFRYLDRSHGFLEAGVIAGAACAAAFAALFIWLVRRRRPEAFALALYLLALLPMFQLPYAGTGLLMTERAAYLPSAGVCWLLAAGAVWMAQLPHGRGSVAWDLRRFVVPALVVSLLAAFTVRSAARIGDWRDEVALFDEGLRYAPNSYHLHAFRGETLLRHARPAEAVEALQKSVQLRPDYADAHNLLGRAWWLLERPEPALGEYRRAAELSLEQGRPDSAARAWNNIGIVYRNSGRNEQAIAAYRRALELDPDSSGTRNNLGFALLSQGDIDQAIAELRLTLAKDPALAPAHANLGLALAMRGDRNAGWGELLVAERLSPADAEVQARLGEIELARGNLPAGRARLDRALQLRPDNPRALAALARIGAK